MEDNSKAVSDSKHQASSNDENSNANQSVSYETYEKLLKQRKNDQKKNSAILEELEELREFQKSTQLQKQQEEGNFLEVIDGLRNDNKQLKQKIKETTEKVAFDKFSAQVKAVAKESGCVDTDTFMRLLSKDQMASVQMDDRMNANTEDIERLVSQFKENKPYMFGSHSVNHTPVNMGGFKKSEPKQVADMSKDEIVAALKQL